jgi:hypothetical protein
VKETLKRKLDVDFHRYKILGACNPKLAHEALKVEDKVGTMLPCNLIVQELDSDQVEVAAIDPVASMQAIENLRAGKESNRGPAEAPAGNRKTLTPTVAPAKGETLQIELVRCPQKKQQT